MRRSAILILCAAAMGLLGGCTDSRAQAYRHDHKAFLRELVNCQSNYATIGRTPECRAAFKVNSELFPY